MRACQLAAGVFGLSMMMGVCFGAERSEKDILFMYSNMCVHPDTQDLLGDRVLLMRYPDGDYVYFQTAEGVIQPPEVGKATISPKNSDVAFTLPQPDKSAAVFKGKMTNEMLIGTFNNSWTNRSGGKEFRLPRVFGRQTAFEKCK